MSPLGKRDGQYFLPPEILGVRSKLTVVVRANKDGYVHELPLVEQVIYIVLAKVPVDTRPPVEQRQRRGSPAGKRRRHVEGLQRAQVLAAEARHVVASRLRQQPVELPLELRDRGLRWEEEGFHDGGVEQRLVRAAVRRQVVGHRAGAGRDALDHDVIGVASELGRKWTGEPISMGYTIFTL